MRRLATWLLIALPVLVWARNEPAWLHAGPWLALAHAETTAAAPAQSFDLPLAASVFGAALAFIAPRTLEETTIPELTLWGLHGITAIDPTLTTELRDGALRLLAPDHVVFSRASPAPDNSAAWGQVAAELNQAAAGTSDAMRGAGTQRVIQSFFDELFNHLDPYSRYVPPAPAELDRGRLSGEGGIGVRLARSGGDLVIGEVEFGSSGAAAGLHPGDRLIAVDGQPVDGQDPSVVGGWLIGPEGSEVRLTVSGKAKGGKAGRVRDVAAVRQVRVPETVHAERDGNLLVISLTAFSADTAERLSAALDANLHGARRPRGVVLDLRGNRGGLLRQAVTCVALLLDDGLVATTAGRNPQASHVWRIEGGDLTHGLPVAVLVDGRTASAAEIMAAALADQRRAVVVGSTTLGKGLVQTLTQLPDGGELFVTWSRVLAPLGWPIQGLGVMPQVCTSLGLDTTKRELRDLAQGVQDQGTALLASRQARAPLPVARILEIRAACPAAEGRDDDLDAARSLIDTPKAYETALLAGVGSQ